MNHKDTLTLAYTIYVVGPLVKAANAIGGAGGIMWADGFPNWKGNRLTLNREEMMEKMKEAIIKASLSNPGDNNEEG